MKYYVVVDTNVLVSAFLKPDSNPGLIYKLIQQEILIPLINDRIINEYLDVLSREKFHLPNEIISKIVESVKAKAISIIEDHIEIELPDEKDRVFYEVVMKSNKERESFLVTGNIKHFPSKPFIVTPRELCDFIINSLCEKDLVNL